MPIIGMGIKKMEATKNGDVTAKVAMVQKPQIKELRVRKLDFLGKDGIEIEYEYSLEYQTPDRKSTLASIAFHGDIVYLPEGDEKIEEIVDAWSKDKKISPKLMVRLMNGMIRRCTTRTVALAEDLGLPSPARFPHVRMAKG